MKKLVPLYCDFQIHSPRDRRYFGWQSEKMTLEGLEEWAEALLETCKSRGVGAIAVTDHHDLWPGIIVLRKSLQIGSLVWVFPGMELTSKSGIQGVLVLDPSLFSSGSEIDLAKAEATANRIAGAMGQNITAGARGSRTLTVTSLSSLRELASRKPEDRPGVFHGPDVERLDRDLEGEDGIAANIDRVCKEQYVLLPNLEKNKQGVFGNEYGRALYAKGESWFSGGYVGGPNATDEDAIQGRKAKDFGARVVTCVRTSDQRGKDPKNWISDRVGTTECGSWLKLSEPTVNSISQALISGKDRRVFDTIPKAPLDFIEQLDFTGVEIFGTSHVCIQLSPYLTTLIGGRGVGKSLLLSALLRLFAADREWIEKKEEELLPWESRHLALFKDDGPFFGTGVSLSVMYRKESGVRYRLTLDSPGDDLLEHRKLEMETPGGWQQIATEAAAVAAIDFHPLFFLQGQMSAITGARLEQRDLTNLIEGPIRSTRAIVRGKLQELAGAVQDGMLDKAKLKGTEAQVRQAAAQVKQKESDRKAFLDAAKKGLTEEQQALFTEGEVFRKGQATTQDLESAVDATLRALTTELQDLSAARDAAKSGIQGLEDSKRSELKAEPYVEELVDVAKVLEKDLKELIARLSARVKGAQGNKKAFAAKLEALLRRAAEVGEKERARREALKKAEALEKEITQLTKQQNSFSQEVQRIKRAGKIEKGEAALAQYRQLVREYSEQLEKRAQKITGNTEFRLIVKIVPGGRYEKVVEALTSLCEGAGVRGSTWGQLEQVLKASVSPATVLTDLFETMIRAQSESSETLPPGWSKGGFTDKVFNNIRTRTTIEQWVQMSVVLADDKVEVLYKTGRGKPPIPILSASPGERAVELLKLALFSTSGPLIIDQPEDDLDNQFLADRLVALVQDAKQKNQLVFASHNANLVVHGDSEVIHVMGPEDRPGGKVGCSLQKSGTIDQEDVCEKVEEVMEGGREAFEKRRRKYHETIAPR